MAGTGNVVKLNSNVVYAKDAISFDPFVWAGECAYLGDITKPKKGRNPTYCQDARNGGIQITGTSQTLQGLPTTSLTIKEVIKDALASDLEDCLWHFDRRTYYCDYDQWNKWEKIRRICLGGATERTDNGSSIDADDVDGMTSLAVTGTDVSNIYHVAIAVQTAIDSILAPWLDVDVCHGERCKSKCGSDNECVIATVSALVAGGSPYLAVNTRGGHQSYWTSYALTEWTTDDAIAVLCLGDFLLIASEATVDSQFLRSYDRGVTRTELTGNTDMATNPVTCLDAINQAFVVAGGQNGYLYGSTDNADSWETLEAGAATTEDINKVLIVADDPSIIYAIGDNNAMLKSENGGGSFFAITGPSVGDNLTSIYALNENHILVGNDDGELWQTEDGASTWTLQSTWPGLTPGAGTTVVRDIAGCGCGVLWAIVADTSVTSFSTDTEQRLYRNVDGGASGRWYLEENGDMDGILNGHEPYAVACCGPNRAVVVGGDATGLTSNFVAVAS